MLKSSSSREVAWISFNLPLNILNILSNSVKDNRFNRLASRQLQDYLTRVTPKFCIQYTERWGHPVWRVRIQDTLKVVVYKLMVLPWPIFVQRMGGHRIFFRKFYKRQFTDHLKWGIFDFPKKKFFAHTFLCRSI